MDIEFQATFPLRSKAKLKAKLKYQRGRSAQGNGPYQMDRDFECTHCRQHVSAHPILSGVKNRNHCPYCLWSRHLDLWNAGDRLAACKAQMKPVALTLKRTRKKYGKDKEGELMLVHICVECAKASINRIAADDVTQLIFDVFEESRQLDLETKNQLENLGTKILESTDLSLVEAQLLGRISISVSQ